MAVIPYLAMTAAEFEIITPLPPKTAWMACRLSPDGPGLDGFPASLPPGSLLMLTDEQPFREHDPGRILQQLTQAVQQWNCAGVLLDFQKPADPALTELAICLSEGLPCPTAVSEHFAADLTCPVFLSPCLHHIPLAEHIAPWQGRELWLDLAWDAEVLMLTETGAAISPLLLSACPPAGFREERLHCHYAVETGEDFARFTLWRTREDLDELAREAEGLGIHTFIGLWKEWRKENDGYCNL